MAKLLALKVTNTVGLYTYFLITVQREYLFKTEYQNIQCVRKNGNHSKNYKILESGRDIYFEFSFGFAEAIEAILESGETDWNNINQPK